MRRGSKLPDMGWTGRQRGRKTVLLMAAVSTVLMMIFIPQYLEMNGLPDIDSPMDRLENSVVQMGDLGKASHTSHRRRNQEESEGASDSKDRPPEMPSSIGDEDILKTESKISQDPPVSFEAICSFAKDAGPT